MPKAQNFIYDALRSIGVLRAGQTAAPEVLADGFTMLNSMVAAWNNESLMIQVVRRDVFPTVGGKQVYTLGTGGDWNIPRPTTIQRAGVLIAGNPNPVEYPIDKLTSQNWAENYPTKNIPSSLFTAFYADNAFPLINVTLWPNPSVSTAQFVLYSLATLTQFADLNVTDYTFPPGYDLAIRFNLGLMLWPLMVVHSKSQQNPVQLSQVEAIARAEKAKIKNLNAPIEEMRVDPLFTNGPGFWNWRTGEGGNS